MERKWAEGVCVDNGVVAGLLADDFQGTSPKGARFRKPDELKDEKGPRTAHDCGLDEAKVHFFGDGLRSCLWPRTCCWQRQLPTRHRGMSGLDRYLAETRR
jgi:hypothetical protein